MPRVYIAGPDVFYSNAKELAQEAHAACAARGLEALCPVDNDVPAGPPGQVSREIFENNVELIRRADAVCANISPFRGPSADAGTVWEIGFAHALGKPIVAFSTDLREYKARVEEYPADGALVEDFQGIDNLMITHALRSVHATLEEALDGLTNLHE